MHQVFKEIFIQHFIFKLNDRAIREKFDFHDFVLDVQKETLISYQEFLLAARRVTTPNRTAEYVISTNIETLSKGSRGDGYVGKLRGNNIKSTEYTLYSNGLSPNKHSHIKSGPEKEKLRKELATIVYVNLFSQIDFEPFDSFISEHEFFRYQRTSTN